MNGILNKVAVGLMILLPFFLTTCDNPNTYDSNNAGGQELKEIAGGQGSEAEITSAATTTKFLPYKSAYVTAYGPDTNWCTPRGQPTELYVGYSTSGSYTGPDYSYLGDFDIGSIPCPAVIDSATLTIYHNSGNPAYAIYIDQIGLNENWSCESTTWNTKPATLGLNVGTTSCSTGYLAQCNFNIKSIVQNYWRNSCVDGDNYAIKGLALKTNITSPYWWYSFYTIHPDTTSNLLPYVTITWHTCDCSSGPCCTDGCNFDEYHECSRIDVIGCYWGTFCGQDVMQGQIVNYCSGSSSLCDGLTAYANFTPLEDCNDTEKCSDSDSTCHYDASCVTPECTPGSGPCCDSSGHYINSSFTCWSTTEYGCPWGASCGNDVGQRLKVQNCSGSSSSCNGSIAYGQWELAADCISTEKCIVGIVTCNYDASCPTTCPDNDGDTYEDDSCGGNDCDDGNASVHPGATEHCDNNVDDDCVGGDATCPPEPDGDGGGGGGDDVCGCMVQAGAPWSHSALAGGFYLAPLLATLWLRRRLIRGRARI